jgi:hypothetical protein
MNPTVLRVLIGAVAGAGATFALASVLRRFGGGAGSVTARLTPADLARGAAAGALLGLLDARPGRIVGAVAGGGLWLASQLSTPDLAIRPARGDASRAVLLAAHLAWGWTAAQTMRELGAGISLD